MNKEIKTPWGKIKPEVSLFPIYFLIFIYFFVYILPYGKFFIGISWFDWLRSEDGPLEWMQFIEYAFSSLLAFLVFFRRKKAFEVNSIVWLLIAFLSFLVFAMIYINHFISFGFKKLPSRFFSIISAGIIFSYFLIKNIWEFYSYWRFFSYCMN